MKRYLKSKYDIQEIDFGIGDVGWVLIRKKWYQRYWFYFEWDALRGDYIPVIYDTLGEAQAALKRYMKK